MDFNNILQDIESCHVTEDGFLIWKIATADYFRPAILGNKESDVVVHIIIEKGELNMYYDGTPYLLRGGAFAHFFNHPAIELVSVSTDIRAYLMAFTADYGMMLFKNNLPLSSSFLLQSRKQPIVILKPNVMSRFLYRISCVYQECSNEKHLYGNEMQRCSIWMYFMDIADILSKQEIETGQFSSNRQRELFVEFMKLLPSYVRKEHSVAFFASRLCVTPQYLNRIINRFTHKTVSEWINLTLIGEISKQLENTNDTMQRIADDFNFPDQASLTKFFKRKTGYSLTGYRKKFIDAK